MKNKDTIEHFTTRSKNLNSHVIYVNKTLIRKRIKRIKLYDLSKSSEYKDFTKERRKRIVKAILGELALFGSIYASLKLKRVIK